MASARRKPAFDSASAGTGLLPFDDELIENLKGGFALDILTVALADQIKSLDWQARRATRKGRASAAELDEIRQKASALLRG